MSAGHRNLCSQMSGVGAEVSRI